MVITISDVLKDKGYSIISVKPDATVYQAIELMSANEIGSVLVVDEGKVVGIISEREYTRKIILENRSSVKTTVEQIMNTDFCFASPESSIEESLSLMTDKRCRHLPVLEGTHLLGVVSIGDLVHSLISKKDYMIEKLEGYIVSD